MVEPVKKKKELFPELTLSGKLVADLEEQSASIGERHDSIDCRFITVGIIYGAPGCIILAKSQSGNQTNQTNPCK